MWAASAVTTWAMRRRVTKSAKVPLITIDATVEGNPHSLGVPNSDVGKTAGDRVAPLVWLHQPQQGRHQSWVVVLGPFAPEPGSLTRLSGTALARLAAATTVSRRRRPRWCRSAGAGPMVEGVGPTSPALPPAI